MRSVARLLTSMFARRNCYGTNQSGRDYTFLQSHQCKKCNQHLIGWKQCRLLHSCVTIKSFVWTLVTIQQLTTNYQQYNTYYDILRLHEKLKNRCLQFINCIGTSNTKSMLIINFPLYWSQSSFCHEVNWVVHRSFCYRVFSQNVGCPCAFYCDWFSNCTLLLWADNLVQCFSSRVSVFTNAWVVCPEEGYCTVCTIAK